MKYRILLLILNFFITGLTTTSAQINLKKIVKETERSINKRVERGIDRKVDDTLDGAEDKVRGKDKKKKKGSNNDYENGNSVKVIKEVQPFNFSGNLTIAIDGTGSIENNIIKVVSDKYQLAVRPLLVKSPNNLMVYDKKDESVTKVNTDLYENRALKEFHTYEPFDSKKTKTEMERTSDIKEIDGFIARKFIVDGDDYEGEIWMSAEVDLDYDLFSSLMEFQRLDLGTMNGFPLEMHLSYKNGDTMDFSVNNVNAGNPSTELFDFDGYEMVDMTDLKSGN